MGLAQSKAFRGSAAFFAMLLAASSGLGADASGMDASFDQGRPALPHAFGGRTLLLPASSKFTRRRLPLARRAIETSSRG